MRKHNFFYALALTPLLMGAGDSTSSALTVNTLPSCGSDQYLMYSGGGLICGKVEVGTAIQFPNCQSQLLTVRRSGDVSSLSCVDRGKSVGPVDMVKLNNLETQVTNLGTLISDIERNPPAGASYFVGVTTASVNGNMKGATDNGFTGAAKMCADQFGAGAHMCTAYEMYDSVAAGKITSAMNIAKSWIYMPTWNNPVSGSLDPLQGMGDTCGSLTYPTGDLRWTGVAVSTGNLRTTRWGLRFHGGSEAPCNQALPVACCK